MSNHRTVYTDGSCKNQGLANASAGYGVYWGQDHPNNRSGPVAGNQNSNRAELVAAQKAIRQAARQNVGHLTIVSDSDYVRRAVHNSSNYHGGSNSDVRQSINALKGQVRVNVEHVKGHSGHKGNAQAHRLAGQGAKK